MKIKDICVIVLLSVIGLMPQGSKAQQNQTMAIPNHNESTIVMTRTQLDSLLAMLVKRKKEALNRRQSATLPPPSINGKSDTPFMKGRSVQRSTNSDYYSNERRQFDEIFDQFDRLNRRIDWMMLNRSQSNGRQILVLPQSDNGQPVVRYVQPAQSGSDPVIRPPYPTGNPYQTYTNQWANVPKRTTDQPAPNHAEQKEVEPTPMMMPTDTVLTNKITALQEKIRVLDTLNQVTKSDEYKAEINQLRQSVQTLQGQLNAQEATADSIARQRQQNSQTLSQYHQVIYFSNNSTAVKPADQQKLQTLVDIVKAHPQVMIFLHGFASSSGDASYNYQVSLKRAEAVKRALLGIGVPTRNIVLMPHGEVTDEHTSKARRVEINLSKL